MKQNNDDWLKALRSKVDDAQMPSAHDADAFEALMARVSASAETTGAAPSHKGRTLRRVAALAAAAMLAGIAVFVFRPADGKEDTQELMADNTTVVEPMINENNNNNENARDFVAVVDAIGVDAAAANLLAQTTPSAEAAPSTRTHAAARVTPPAAEDKTPTPAPSAQEQSATSNHQSASFEQEQAASAASTSTAASDEESKPKQPSADRHLPDASRRDYGYANVDPSLMGQLAGSYDRTGDWHVMLAAAGGGENAGTVTPTFAIPYASSEASSDIHELSGLLAAPTRRGAKPELADALTSYDYEACTFVHHTPIRFKLLALCDVWSPDEHIALSVGSGLMYTELSSTVYPLFINTTYLQRLRFVGIPLEADINWYMNRRWNVFAGVGLTGEYCFSAMLHNQRQPERNFHFGAYEQVGVGMRLTSDLRLGVACDYSQTFTPTVLKTLRNTPATLGVNVSLTCLLR